MDNTFTPNPNLPNNGYTSMPTPNSQPNAPTQNAGGGSWLQKLLPTIGGIALPTIADLVTGGLALPADAALAAVGGAGGKAIENATTGQNALQGNDITSGIESGIGQGVGGALAKGAQGLLGAGSNALSNVVSNREDATAADTLKQELTGLTTKDKIAGGVGTGVQTIKDMGIKPTAENIAAVPQAVGNAFNDHINNVLNTTGTVDLSAAGRQIATLDKATQDTLTPNLNGVGGFSKTASPTDARSLLTSVQKAQANAKPVIQSVGQKIDPVAQQQYNSLGKVVDELKGAIYNRPGVNEAFANAQGSVTPEQILKTSPTLTPDEAQKAADYANTTLNGATKGQDVLTPWSKLISLGDAGDKAVTFNKEVVPIDGVKATNNETQLLDQQAQNTAALVHPHLGMAAKGINALGSNTVLKPLAKVTGKAAASKIIPTLMRAGGVAAANLLNDVGTPQSAIPTQQNQQTNQGGVMQPDQNPTQQYYQTLLSQLQAQPADAQTGSILSALNGVVPNVQKQQLAAPVVSNLLNTFNQAGGAQGAAGGGLSTLTGLIPGTAANTFQRTQATTADTLASLLGITPAAAMQMLPQLMQNQPTAQNSTNALQGILGGISSPQSAIPAQ